MIIPTGEFTHFIVKSLSSILAKTKVTPNQLTFFGLLVNCVVAYLLAQCRLSYLIIGILILIAGLFDALDGGLARLQDALQSWVISGILYLTVIQIQLSTSGRYYTF